MEKLRATERPRVFVYRCQCGNETTAFDSNVNRGTTRSCGCVRRAVNATKSRTHGHKVGGERTKAYRAWVNMKARCDNANREDFVNYGGRGIKYDPAWKEFSAFLADMGEPSSELTLDRTDNDGGYSKENCRWATRAEQALNKRNCVRYSIGEKSLTLAEWSRETGVQAMTILKRIQRGVPVQIAAYAKGYLKQPTNDATNGLIRIA